jgi:hypothetical protein
MGGGGGDAGGGDAGAGGSGGGDAKKDTNVECKLNFKPVIIGVIAGIAIGYFYAKNKNKDIKTFGVVFAIIGAVLGYAYAKHQCEPIDLLTKLKVPSKSNVPAPVVAKPSK